MRPNCAAAPTLPWRSASRTASSFRASSNERYGDHPPSSSINSIGTSAAYFPSCTNSTVFRFMVCASRPPSRHGYSFLGRKALFGEHIRRFVESWKSQAGHAYGASSLPRWNANHRRGRIPAIRLMRPRHSGSLSSSRAACHAPFQVGGRIMSRIAVAATFIGYFFAALAFAAFMQAEKPFPSLSTVTIAEAIGAAASIYVISAILPMIIWALFRFRSMDARGPMILWGCLGIVVCYFNYLGARSSQEGKLVEWSNGLLAQGNRAEFIASAAKSCVETQSKIALARHDRLTIQQIDAYCRCYGDKMFESMTPEELRYWASTGGPAPFSQEKANQAGAMCVAAARQAQ